MASIKVFMTNEDKEKEIVGIPRVSKRLSKKLTKTDGTIMFFIKKDHGIKQGLMAKMNFRTLHPIDDSFCEITIELERF